MINVLIIVLPDTFLFFFFNDTATTEIYTLSLHDALPISWIGCNRPSRMVESSVSPGQTGTFEFWYKAPAQARTYDEQDRKSTRLNSSHSQISYAVFCLKKKKNQQPLYHIHIIASLSS